MNLQIIFKDKEKVTIVSDTYYDSSIKSKVHPNNLRIWSPKGSKNTLVCCASGAAPKNKEMLLKYDEKISELSNSEEGIRDYNLLNEIVLDLNKFSVSSEVADLNKGVITNTNLSAIIAQDNRAYILTSSGTVRELNDTQIYGYGSDYFLSALDELDYIEDKVSRVLVSLLAFNESIYFINFPVSVMDTKTLTPKNYSLDDIKRIAKKYKRGGDK